AITGAFIHFLPQLAILLVVCIFIFGWVPSLATVGLALAAMIIVLCFILGLGLLFSAFNVRFRDASNVVEIIRTIATWASPILYTWVMVRGITDSGPWIFHLYMTNPVTIAVEFFHHSFWDPAVPESARLGWPPDMGWYVAGGCVIIAVLLVLGQFVFRRLERTFAQDL